MDFVSSQTADNKIKTAADPAKPLFPMETITALTQINVSMRTHRPATSNSPPLLAQSRIVLPGNISHHLGSEHSKPLHGKAAHNQELVEVSGGCQTDSQVDAS